MARPREFDPLKVLDQAMRVFWEKGYEGASLSLLTDAMGLGKASLYSAFESKENLFIQSLGRYHTRIIGPWLEPLFEPDTNQGLDTIEHVLDALIDRLTSQDTPAGCLVAIASVECVQGKRPLLRKVGDILADFETGFYQGLRKAQIDGVLDVRKDPRQIARALTSTAQGMAVMSRAGSEMRALNDISRWTMDSLRN